MDYRILIGVVAGLVLVAFGGFYFAIGGRSHQGYVPPGRPIGAPTVAKPAPSANKAAPTADKTAPTADKTAPTADKTAPSAQKATAETIEAEIARSDYAELQTLLKKHFAEEYKGMIEVAVRRRNEGGTEQALGQEAFSRFQEIMRSKLKFAVAASMPLIDKLAANEVKLFHALGTEGTQNCLGVLGKVDAKEGAPPPPPDGIKQLMRQATVYRFEAIVDGMARFEPVTALTQAELGAFEASLVRVGLKLDEVRSGGFLNKEGDGLGKPCLMVEKLYNAVSQLDESARRKLYASMFFLGRDK